MTHHKDAVTPLGSVVIRHTVATEHTVALPCPQCGGREVDSWYDDFFTADILGFTCADCDLGPTTQRGAEPPAWFKGNEGFHSTGVFGFTLGMHKGTTAMRREDYQRFARMVSAAYCVLLAEPR